MLKKFKITSNNVDYNGESLIIKTENLHVEATCSNKDGKLEKKYDEALKRSFLMSYTKVDTIDIFISIEKNIDFWNMERTYSSHDGSKWKIIFDLDSGFNIDRFEFYNN